MKNGDVVFFKRAKGSAHRRAPEAMFKGMGFGILLGHVPPFAQNPPAAYVIGQIGSIGYLSFDDVIEFLGDEAGATCVKKFEEKYLPKVDPAQASLPLDAAPPATPDDDEEAAPSGIVGLDGKPIESAPSGESNAGD